mmetsp:Transcript_8753/g.17341  ORF Transcript_8753/g.17341 Transcript_8753/m.17341 type:complete len:100 (-) Transcript_8753:1450-1749(-)
MNNNNNNYFHSEFSVSSFPNQVNYHCSPTLTLPFFLPLPPLPFPTVNLAGSNGRKSKQRHSPSKTNSAIAIPHAGAHAIPQQLCPALMYPPRYPGTRPM